MPQKIVAALDIGTTGIRVMGFSKEKKVVARYYRPIEQIYPGPGMVEQDPMKIVSISVELLGALLDEFGKENVCCLGITNQRETTILWENSTGRPIHNAIVWQDQRTARMCEEFKSHEPEVRRRTGLIVNPYFSATKIMWLLDNVEGARRRALDGELLFGTPDTWVLWNLTGGKVHATEPGNASRTMLYNIYQARFDPDLLEVFDIPKAMLPDVYDSDALFGHTDKNIIGSSIPIRAILGDQQASLYGQGGADSSVIKATYGTGIFILQTTATEVVEAPGLLSTIAWARGGQITYALEGSILMGGASLQWLEENLGILDDVTQCGRIAQSLPDNQGVYFVPAFQGLGSPHWNPDARALLIGMSRHSSRDTIIRAALESMAYQVRDVIDVMSRINKSCSVLRVDGGAVDNEFLMRFQANLLKTAVERPKVTETTAVGVAALAGVSAGIFSEDDMHRMRGRGDLYEPADNCESENRCYANWKEAVRLCSLWKDSQK